MSRCAVCNSRSAFNEYGGTFLCDYHYEMYNPKVTTIKKMTEKQRDWVERAIIEHESQILKLKRQLETDDKIIESGHDSLDFTSSYPAVFK